MRLLPFQANQTTGGSHRDAWGNARGYSSLPGKDQAISAIQEHQSVMRSRQEVLWGSIIIYVTFLIVINIRALASCAHCLCR